MKRETVEKLVADIARLIADRAPEETTTAAPLPLLTACDVAARLQINTQAVYRLAREGKLPAIKLSTRTLRWTEDAVSAFVAGGGIIESNADASKTLRVLRPTG